MSLAGRYVEFVVHSDPEVLTTVRFLSSATASQPLVCLLTLLISAHLSLGEFLNDVLNCDLLRFSALESLLD